MDSLRALMTSIIDYAGLFPPSKLDMQPAVRNYASYLESSRSWMLGRFVLPVSRFQEFELIADRYLPRGEDAEPWRVSALVGPDLDADIDRIFAFNHKHMETEGEGRVVVDVIELKGGTPSFIDEAMEIIPEQLEPYFEIPWQGDLRGPITALSGTDGRAKIRCGGPIAELFPPSDRVASFIATCAAAGVPFKFTAGLHHPVRAEHALTYESDSARGMMHGFLNAFLAASFARAARFDESRIREVLEEEDAGAFDFSEEGVIWRGEGLDAGQLAHVRETFAISFGSCSFEEPWDDLVSLELLDDETGTP